MREGFKNDSYIFEQTKKILERIASFDNKLYLEFGGKLFDDLHASRVLPGFKPDVKTELLIKLKDQLEIIFCINANDIERNKMRADFGITYGEDIIRITGSLRSMGLMVSSIVITQFTGQPSAETFKNKLERMGEHVYIHTPTKGYPRDVNTIVSDEGYGANPYIETTRPLVVVNAPGPNSGKLGTCLSQLYHELRRGVKAGYAKFETFPVWNLPLNHPVNVAYEAATADIRDYNIIDNFHLDAYGESSVNYNRDVEVFPIVKDILTKIMGSANPYKSPTDMGVNTIASAIIDDNAVRDAAKQEIIRRYYKSLCDYKMGCVDIETVHRIELLMNKLGISIDNRTVVNVAIKKSEQCGVPAVAIQLDDGTIIVGKDNSMLKATSSMLLNALKHLANIEDQIKLIASIVIDPILKMKKNVLKSTKTALDIEEALIALSITSTTSPMVEFALDKLSLLKDTEAHSTVMLEEDELQIFRNLGINITSEAQL